MATRLDKNATDSGEPERGRGGRAFGARLLGALLLALGLGLGYEGVVSGIYEPIAKSTAGVISVESCTHNEGRRAPKECDGTFTSQQGTSRDRYAEIATDDPYPAGHRIDVVQIGSDDPYTYATSTVWGAAAGLRYLFGGLCALGPALFCLVTGRGPVPRAAGALRSLHPAFSLVTFSFAGVGLLGLIVSSMMS